MEMGFVIVKTALTSISDKMQRISKVALCNRLWPSPPVRVSMLSSMFL